MINANQAIGIDIGGTHIRAGLVRGHDLLGDVKEVETPQTLDEFKRVLAALVSGLQQTLDSPVPVGMAVPSIIHRADDTIIQCPNLSYLNGLSSSGLIDNHSVAIGNDADMALYGEMAVSDLWHQDVLLLTLGTGLGSAFYVGGKGSWELNFAGEAGHMKVVPDGELCNCGGKGCLEAYFSATALIKRAQAEIDTNIREVEEVFNRMQNGDDRSGSIIREASKLLGIGIANLINILGADNVILGGKISRSYEWFIEPVLESAKANIFAESKRYFSVRQSSSVDKAGIIGAARQAAQK